MSTTLILGFPADTLACLCVAALTLVCFAVAMTKWWRAKL